MSPDLKTAARWALTVLLLVAGSHHLVEPQVYVAIMPGYLPLHLELVYLCGALKIVGALGLVSRRTRVASAWGLVALFICMFPANVHMAVHRLPLGGVELPGLLLWLRLPFQLVFILWAWWFTRADQPNKVAPGRVSR